MKKNHKNLLVWIMALLMVFNLIPFPMAVYAEEEGADVTDFLTDIVVEVKQDGNIIPEGGELTSTKPISVKISFGVPVKGDYPDPLRPVEKGDFAVFELSGAFKLLEDYNNISLKFYDYLVGILNIERNDEGMIVAHVDFDGDDVIFADNDINTVKCYFSAELEFDPQEDPSPGGECDVLILEKTYTVKVPPLETEYTVTKSGTVNLAEKYIEWKVEITAKQGDQNIDLEGYIFSDDLGTVGSYMAGHFTVGGETKAPVIDGSTISYTFPEGSTSPRTIIFRTAISDVAYHATTEQSVKNIAQLLDEEEVLLVENDYTVKFTPKWIEKSGFSSDVGSGNYDPTNRTITWEIIANHMGATLDNVVITDELPDGLTWKSAKLEKWDGNNWAAVDCTEWTAEPAAGKYSIGNINTKIKLTIVAEVPDEDYTAGTKTYTNSARITWEGLLAPGLGTGGIGVPVGYVPIAKTGTVKDEDHPKGIITWTVTVDPRGQDIPELKVYDLLVYGSSTSGFNLNMVTGIPSGVQKGDLVPRYDQRYVDDSFAGTGLTLTVHAIEQDGVRVADLLEVTGFLTTEKSFTFESQITNPSIFAGNKTTPVQNTASLFSGDKWLNKADATVNFASRTLAKEMLKREAMADPAAGVNDYTTNAGLGFDYQDKSVIFRLSINADGLDLTKMENAAEEKLGKAIVTDTLPAGWEFVEIDPDKMFLIFAGEYGSGTVQAKGTPPTPVSVTGLSADFSVKGIATFTFETLDQPYVILVKAKPSDGKLAGYFSDNRTTTVQNRLSLKTENWTPGVSVNRNVTIESKLLDKDYAIPEAGVLKWTVDYRPYDLSQQGTKLKDKIPEGLELRTDSTGALLIEGNITVREMTLNANGSYTEGDAVTLTEGDNISYDREGRLLKFTIPDAGKGYRFSYITDITGEPGVITNRVALCDELEEQENAGKSYAITAADGGASLQRNGWMEIKKRDGASSTALSGAEFTLFATDGTTVIRKGVTGADGSLRFKVVPDGEYIFRETGAPGEYNLEGVDHTLTVITIDGVPTASIDGKTGDGSNEITIRNYKEGTAGDLIIRKFVAGNGGNNAKKFDFTVTFDLPAGVSVEGAYDTYIFNSENVLVGMGLVESGDTISLAHGEHILITGLPKETEYSVAELDYRGEGYVTISQGESGAIVVDNMVTAEFTNTRNVGSLTITKTVAGNGGDHEKVFDFTVEFTPPEGMPDSYTYTGHGVSDGVITSGDTISLAHGQSITIEEIPEGTVYTVTEKDYTGDAYVSSGLIESGTIATDVESVASFTNTRNVGSLTITKAVAGNGGDHEKEFDFTVEFTPPEGMPDSYNYTGHGVSDGVITSGDTISLAHGQSITIEELPEGTVYSVMEADYTADNYVTGSIGAGGIIAVDEDDDEVPVNTAAFTNTRKVSTLMIKKTVGGALGDRDRDFTFVVELEVSGIYRYWGSKRGSIESGQAITLKHGEYIVIEGVPVDTAYRVTEVEANRDGYCTTSTGAVGEMGELGRAADFVNTKVDLPRTGAGGLNGIPGWLLLGSLFVLLTATGLFMVSRNRRGLRSH